MTQEEKVIRYDEALEIAKKNYVTAQDLCEDSQIGVECFKNTLVSIFPELKGSEDERIRKAIIEFFELQDDNTTYSFIPKKDILTWLEKQGKKPQGKSALEAINEKKVDNQNCVKPTNKVEPKFRKGDWITNGDYTWKVISVDNFDYALQNQWDVYTEDTIDYVNKAFHLWTIQDAKDGDILVDKDNNIGIYKEIEGIYWDSYIYLGCDGELRGFSIGGKHEQTDTHPATKEQRDTLMKAMTDAGYTFDFDKKELKLLISNGGDFESNNSKQKSVEWSEEDESIMNNLCHFLEEYGNQYYGHLTLQGTISWLKSIRHQKQ